MKLAIENLIMFLKSQNKVKPHYHMEHEDWYSGYFQGIEDFQESTIEILEEILHQNV